MCSPGGLHLTGSLLFAAPGCHLSDLSAGEIVLRVSGDSAELLLSGVRRVLRIVLWDQHRTEMAMGSDSPADGRSGVNFNLELQVSWNAPEAYVNLDSDGVYKLKTVPDVLGLHASVVIVYPHMRKAVKTRFPAAATEHLVL